MEVTFPNMEHNGYDLMAKLEHQCHAHASVFVIFCTILLREFLYSVDEVAWQCSDSTD